MTQCGEGPMESIVDYKAHYGNRCHPSFNKRQARGQPSPCGSCCRRSPPITVRRPWADFPGCSRRSGPSDTRDPRAPRPGPTVAGHDPRAIRPRGLYGKLAVRPTMLSLTVSAVQIVLLPGPNGSCKSSTLLPSTDRCGQSGPVRLGRPRLVRIDTAQRHIKSGPCHRPPGAAALSEPQRPGRTFRSWPDLQLGDEAGRGRPPPVRQPP